MFLKCLHDRKRNSTSDGHEMPIQTLNCAIILPPTTDQIAGSSGKFRPNAPVTRQEMAAMVIKALTFKQKYLDEAGENLAGFTDRDRVSGWARPALAKAVKAKVINGQGAGKLAPQDNATRAEASVMVKKIIDLVG